MSLINRPFKYRQGSKQAKAINVVFIWVAAGFVGTQFGLFLNCRPFHEYWAVPTERSKYPTLRELHVLDLSQCE